MAVDNAEMIVRLRSALIQLRYVDGGKANEARVSFVSKEIESVIKDLQTLVDDGK